MKVKVKEMLLDDSKCWLVVEDVNGEPIRFYPVVGWDRWKVIEDLQAEGWPEYSWHPVVYQGSSVELFDDYSDPRPGEWTVRRCSADEWEQVMACYETVKHNQKQDADLLAFLNRVAERQNRGGKEVPVKRGNE